MARNRRAFRCPSSALESSLVPVALPIQIRSNESRGPVQILGGRMTKFDSFVTRTWVQLGFMTTLGSILPPLLILFGGSTLGASRVSSGVMAVILGSWALTFRRRRHAVNPTRLPLQVVTFTLAMNAVALTLAANA